MGIFKFLLNMLLFFETGLILKRLITNANKWGEMLDRTNRYIEELYNQYYRDVYQFALYYTNNKQDAEDITQETFIKVMRNFSQLKDETKQKTWILSIARNTAVDIHRKQVLRRLLPSKLEKKSQLSGETAEQRVLMQEDWALLQEALLSLKPHYRSLVILKGLKEFSNKETAAILGCTELKVRVDYHRAIAKMKKDRKLEIGVDLYAR
ncbi:RNA polymerase sigma factor [Psychrobacillus glaciei]|uniref:RNA polymerase sigma factor n=1 Tax=Psychrobacillus glaciei TaxID=2283160 RepID=A0A5J6SSG3_9BACI|nr:RNA polymerase sigma factor [Psychrobacillus glaciei]QFF99137.1 RNA polymerase sigma factor [Psychrobacillus glaciei]